MVSLRSDWAKRVMQAAGLSVSVLAVLVLIGWHMHTRALIQVLPGLAPMQRMTALGFLLSGIALVLLSTGRKRAAGVCALAVLTLSGVVSLEYMFRADFGIDELLGRDYINVHTSNPGRMSPVTAICFLGSSLALLVAASRRLARFASAIVGILASMLIAVGTVSVLGYMLGRTETYGWSHFARMALHTSACFAAVGVGLLAWAWQESKIEKGAPRWLPLSIGLGLAAGALGIWQGLMAHEASKLPLLSGIVLAGGIAAALLVAVAVFEAQQAQQRSRELAEGKEMLERLFEASPDTLLLTDQRGRIIRANERVAATFGYTRDELLGQSIEILVPEKARGIHQTHRERYYVHPSTRLIGQELELYARHKNGSELPVEIALSSVQAGSELQVLAVVRDITERKRAEQKLQESEARLRLQIDRMPIGCMVVDKELRILSWNPAAEQIFGFSAKEAVGQHVYDCIVPPDLQPQIDSVVARLVEGDETAHSTNENLTKDGRRITCEWTNTPLRGADGTVYGILAMAQDITARKLAEDALRESEERFRSLFEQGPIGYVLMGMDRRMIKVNAAYCRMLGYSEAELTSMSPLDVTHPEDRAASADLIQRLFQSGSPTAKIEKRYVKKTGEIVWASLTASAVRDREGRPLYSVGLIEDITERRRAEAELRLGSEIFANMEEGVCLVRLEDAIIVHANPKFEKMLGYNPNELTGRHIAQINSSTYQHPEETAEEIREEMRRSGVWRGEILHQRKDGTPFWCAVTVSSFHHPEFGTVGVSIHQDITDLKKAQETLRESEERFRNIFEQGPIGITLLAPDARFLKVNPAFCRMLGYSEAELIGKTPLDITHPEDRPPSVQLMEEIFTGKAPTQQIEKRYVKKSGEIMWASVTASLIRDVGGKPLYRVGMVEDITERKQAEQKLAEQAALLDLAHDSISVRDLEGKIIFWNQGARQTYGWPAEEALGRTPQDLLHTRYPIPLTDIEETVLTKGAWEGELQHTTRDGRTIIVTSRWSLQRDERGSPKAFLVINRDITDRKQAEKKLAEQAALLNLAHDAIIVRDPESRVVFWNRGATDTYGWSAEEAKGRVTHELLQTRFPVPLEQIEAAVLTQGAWEGELQHTTRDGRTIIVTSRWSLQRDERGRPSAVLEINRDITQRKRAEEELRTLSERLSLATKTANIGIWDWDLRTGELIWDDTEFALFRIPKKVPMEYADFARTVHPDDLPKVEASVRRAIEQKTQDFVEFRIIWPDGSVRHILAAEGAVLDEHGNVVRVVGTGTDITERKEMEAQIEANKVQLVTSARLSALGMMAGNIAHEINNPVGIIHALASDLMDMVEEEGAAPPEMVSRNSARIRETAERIARIVKSMRQISREGSRDKFYPTRVGKVVEETLEICRERFRANAVKLLLPKEMPELSAPCREVQIEQVLLNLLQNAFDAVVEQPGERWVRLDVVPSDDSVVISVTDNGPGIPPQLRPRVMEPFFTTKPVGKGTGLGLSLSKTIAEEHGGKLEYSEHEGHTRFSLVLPMAREAEAVWT